MNSNMCWTSHLKLIAISAEAAVEMCTCVFLDIAEQSFEVTACEVEVKPAAYTLELCVERSRID